MFCFGCSSTFWHKPLCIHIYIQKARSFIQLNLSQVGNSCSLFLRPWCTYSLNCSLHQGCLFIFSVLMAFCLTSALQSATVLTCESWKDEGALASPIRNLTYGSVFMIATPSEATSPSHSQCSQLGSTDCLCAIFWLPGSTTHDNSYALEGTKEERLWLLYLLPGGLVLCQRH